MVVGEVKVAGEKEKKGYLGRRDHNLVGQERTVKDLTKGKKRDESDDKHNITPISIPSESAPRRAFTWRV